MMQPAAISGAVAKPNSSAPSSAPIDDVAARAQAAVHLHGDAAAQTVDTSVCCVSARPISHGEPACLIEVSGEAPVPPSMAGDGDVIGVRLGDAGGDRADADLRDQLHRDAQPSG